jgi:mono/diheme cytochrome c family protein
MVDNSSPDGLDATLHPSTGAAASGGSSSQTGGGLGSVAGLSSGGSVSSNGGAPSTTGNAGSNSSFGSGTSGGSPGSAGSSASGNGLNCDVNRILTPCQSCHGLLPGAPALATRDDLLKPSVEQAGKRLIDVAIARMSDPQSPMPPAPSSPVAASDIALVSAWATSGTPAQSCTPGQGQGGATGMGGAPNGGSGAPNGGGSGGRMGQAGALGSGGATAAVCTSNVTWKSGNGANMRPGDACGSCHNFALAGTVYPTAHEPAHCNGVTTAAGVKVIITGANGTSVTLTPGTAGNFNSNTKITMPYTVKLMSANGMRAMLTPQTSGDCNSCHTQNGANGAPGRIMAP